MKITPQQTYKYKIGDMIIYKSYQTMYLYESGKIIDYDQSVSGRLAYVIEWQNGIVKYSVARYEEDIFGICDNLNNARKIFDEYIKSTK